MQAEADHRRHAIIEQVIADLKNGPLAHLPSGRFNANGAWLVLATIAFNLTRAAGALASAFHAKATTATIRATADQRPGPGGALRPPRPLRLPTNWPWADDWHDLLTAAIGPPAGHCLTTGPTATTRDHVERPGRPADPPRPSQAHPNPRSTQPRPIRFGASGLSIG